MSAADSRDEVEVSAVLVTWNRPSLLARAVESVQRAWDGPRRLRLVVALNGEDAASERVLRGLPSVPGVELVTLRLEPRLRPGHARNVAASRATGDWIFFLDDDAYVDPEYFTRWRALRERHPDADVLGGPNLTPPGAPEFEQLTGRVLVSRFACWLSRRRYAPLGADGPATDESFILCNLWVRRKAFTGFHPELDCNEENLLLQQLHSRGARLIHSPGLWLWHERRSTASELARQVFKYGTGRAQNTRLRPASVRWAHLAPPLALLAAPWLAYLALAHGHAGALAPFVAYALASGLAALRCAGTLRAAPLFPLIHVAYGAGFLAGWLKAPVVASRGVRTNDPARVS